MLWFEIDEFYYPVDVESFEMEVSRGFKGGARRYIETNNYEKHKKGSACQFNLEDGTVVIIAGTVKIKPFPLGDLGYLITANPENVQII